MGRPVDFDEVMREHNEATRWFLGFAFAAAVVLVALMVAATVASAAFKVLQPCTEGAAIGRAVICHPEAHVEVVGDAILCRCPEVEP